MRLDMHDPWCTAASIQLLAYDAVMRESPDTASRMPKGLLTRTHRRCLPMNLDLAEQVGQHLAKTQDWDFFEPDIVRLETLARLCGRIGGEPMPSPGAAVAADLFAVALCLTRSFYSVGGQSALTEAEEALLSSAQGLLRASVHAARRYGETIGCDAVSFYPGPRRFCVRRCLALAFVAFHELGAHLVTGLKSCPFTDGWLLGMQTSFWRLFTPWSRVPPDRLGPAGRAAVRHIGGEWRQRFLSGEATCPTAEEAPCMHCRGFENDDPVGETAIVEETAELLCERTYCGSLDYRLSELPRLLTVQVLRLNRCERGKLMRLSADRSTRDVLINAWATIVDHYCDRKVDGDLALKLLAQTTNDLETAGFTKPAVA